MPSFPTPTRNGLEGGPPAALIVSQALASKLFPHCDALGKSIFLSSQKQKAPIVGIVERLQEKETQKQLLGLSRARILDQARTMAESRRLAYRDDRGLAIILGVVSSTLLVVTAVGIIGITSFWVAQRRRQIGIRRAMGATRTAILRYFKTENLIIAGAVLGIILALSLNFWMAGKFEMARLDFGYTLIAAVAVLLLGQMAVLWPAMRAASISPVVAIRNT